MSDLRRRAGCEPGSGRIRGARVQCLSGREVPGGTVQSARPTIMAIAVQMAMSTKARIPNTRPVVAMALL